MSMSSPCLRRPAAVLLAVLTLVAPLVAASSTANLEAVGIENFGKINDNYYRGAQPSARDYPTLAALGVRTVIDLTRDGESAEQTLVEQTGMKFYRIPLTTSDRPSDAAVAAFLAIVNNPANQPIFVHCQGGRHRTGAMTAVYRVTADGWTADRAYGEMKQFKFEGFPGHPALKQFVYDYYTQFAHAHDRDEKPVAATVASR